MTPQRYLVKVTEKLTSVIESAVKALGYDLWGSEVLPAGKHTVLRVYIDREKGVNIDDCAEVSRQVSAVLDVEDLMAGQYSLEVSSPGVDRPLFTLEQCQRYIGQRVKVRLHSPLDGRKHFKGSLEAIEENELIVVVDGESFRLPFAEVEKANLTDATL